MSARNGLVVVRHGDLTDECDSQTLLAQHLQWSAWDVRGSLQFSEWVSDLLDPWHDAYSDVNVDTDGLL